MSVTTIRVLRVAYATLLTALILLMPVPAAWADPPAHESPVPEMPGRGVTGTFIQPPDHLPAVGHEDRFTDDGVPVFTTWAMSGMHWTGYDLGTGPDALRCADCVFGTWVANWILDTTKFGVAATAALTDAAYHPSYLSVFDNLIRETVAVLQLHIFDLWVPVTITVVGLLIIWRARAGTVSRAAASIGWALLVLVLAAAVFHYPVKVASLADNSEGQVLGSVHDGITGDTHTNPAEAAGQNMYGALLWQQWLAGNFGSADSEAAKRWGDELFAAQALTWSEAAELRAEQAQLEKECATFNGVNTQCFGTRTPQVVIDKQKDWQRIADEIEYYDPDAYQYLTGHQSSNRVWAGLLSFLAALCVLPLLFMSAILIIAAYLIVRLAVMMFPAIAVLGVLDTLSGLVKGAANTVAAAVINSIVFGIVAALNMLAVTVLLSPQSQIPQWLGITLCALLALVAWFVAKPFRRLTQMVTPTTKGVMADTSDRLRGTADSVMGLAKTAGAAAVGSFAGTKHANDEAAEERATQPEQFTRPADPVPVAATVTTAPVTATTTPDTATTPPQPGTEPQAPGLPPPPAGSPAPAVEGPKTGRDLEPAPTPAPAPVSTQVRDPSRPPSRDPSPPPYVPGQDRPEAAPYLPEAIHPETDDEGQQVYAIYTPGNDQP